MLLFSLLLLSLLHTIFMSLAQCIYVRAYTVYNTRDSPQAKLGSKIHVYACFLLNEHAYGDLHFLLHNFVVQFALLKSKN